MSLSVCKYQFRKISSIISIHILSREILRNQHYANDYCRYVENTYTSESSDTEAYESENND